VSLEWETGGRQRRGGEGRIEKGKEREAMVIDSVGGGGGGGRGGEVGGGGGEGTGCEEGDV